MGWMEPFLASSYTRTSTSVRFNCVELTSLVLVLWTDDRVLSEGPYADNITNPQYNVAITRVPKELNFTEVALTATI